MTEFMNSKIPSNKETQDVAAMDGSEPPPPPFNADLDPDNVTSPLNFAKRVKEGREHFYPEGGPEDPPVESFEDAYRA